MTQVSVVLLSIYTELIVFGPDFYNFLAFVFFVTYMHSIAGQGLIDFIEGVKTSGFELLSKSKIDQSSVLVENLIELDLLSEAGDLVSLNSNKQLNISYPQEEDFYTSSEYVLFVSLITFSEFGQLMSLLNALFDNLLKISKLLVSDL